MDAIPTPPSSKPLTRERTTCKRLQMSKWRQQGFVQDSDEEDESQLTESLEQNVHQERVDERRVEKTAKPPEEGQHASINQTQDRGQDKEDVRQRLTLDVGYGTIGRPCTPKRPTPSPITPILEDLPLRDRTESPDPLQASQTSIFEKGKKHSHETVAASHLPNSKSQPDDRGSSPRLGSSLPKLTPASSGGIIESPQTAANILEGFGVLPLPDSDSDDFLSDPPSDLDAVDTSFATPHRRTQAQVLIPQSAGIPQEVLDFVGPHREFRTRKPIQLHPYAIEGEIYKRNLHSRGIKPVPRAQSPVRKTGHHDEETQEKEFNPDRDGPSSPPEREIPVSTPVVRPQRTSSSRDNARQRLSPQFARRRVPATQSHDASSAKRRKLNKPLTQAVPSTSRDANPNSELLNAIWSIPHSPPYSSSPPLISTAPTSLGRPLAVTPVPTLPTPSTSSNVQDDAHQMHGSDSEPIARNTNRSSAQHRRMITITSEDSASEVEASVSEEANDKELRIHSKKLKGALPASWLRLDRQAQEKRNEQARARERERMRAANSPDTTEPQRGVAQRVTRRMNSPSGTRQSNFHVQDFVVISDESDIEPGEYVHRGIDEAQHLKEDASDIAAMFDRRYADEDSDNMESDRLHLFTLGGTGGKRKRQTKLTDTFSKRRKKPRLSLEEPRAIKAQNRSHGLSSRRSKHASSRSARRTPPPALSVLDLDQSHSESDKSVPQFLRLAKRQARKRADYARQSPADKQIRLHTARDTDDANSALRRWRNGALKPKMNVEGPSQSFKVRRPLANRSDNRQLPQAPSTMDKSNSMEHSNQLQAQVETSQFRKDKAYSQELLIFQRHPPGSMTSSHSFSGSTKSRTKPRQTRQKQFPFRTAQLESDESQFGRAHRKIAFHKELRRVDQQFNIPLSIDQRIQNPQLARFLTADDTPLPSLPSAADIGETPEQSPIKKPSVPKRRLKRKAQAQRVDIETREYRQPSEPAVYDLLNDNTENLAHKSAPQHDPGETSLQGLGAFGTRYPITFDVSPLKVGTYFHPSTFVGSEEFQRALQTGKEDARDLDEPAGYFSIRYSDVTIKCGPWNDEVSSHIANFVDSIWRPPDNSHMSHEERMVAQDTILRNTSELLRSMINYGSVRLSFLDSIDRRDYTARMKQFIQLVLDRLLDLLAGNTERGSHKTLRAITYLLVLCVQVLQIAQHPMVDSSMKSQLASIIASISHVLVSHLVRGGLPELSNFLEKNKRYKERENGIQDEDILVESLTVCIHVLGSINIPRLTFWELVSRELSPQAEKAVHLKDFESVWATTLTLLPYFELNASGVLVVNRRSSFTGDNWNFLRDLLKRLFMLYPSTYRLHGSSLNDYVRATLTRCWTLIEFWHWKLCDTALIAVFDFFAKNNFRHLRREESSGPIQFLQCLAEKPDLSIKPNDTSFHIFLKCLALGLQGMKRLYPEKKVRSFVFRLTPNHGRSYPKDQSMSQDDLVALRNHHDLLCTLYWASPPSCRPKLDLLRGLVHHENSHREACRVSVRSWANLATFQLSTDKPYETVHLFAVWYKEIMQQTLKQYRLAKTEADDYMRSRVSDGTSDMSVVMVRQTIEKNQEQVIATLRECIAGLKTAIKHSADQASSRRFLIDSSVVELLELPHFEDHRLLAVIRDTLATLREYALSRRRQSSQQESQQTSEESQDYGDFPDLDDLGDIDEAGVEAPKQLTLDFIQTSLWHLLSNAFGAERTPDDNLLMDCIDTWVLIASCQVSSNERSWSYYIDSFGPFSYQQLRNTDQTRKFNPYLMSSLIECDASAYEGHDIEFLTILLCSLAERESMLRFQWRLLKSIAKVDGNHPLMKNLPFSRDEKDDELDITPDTLRSRRLALISSILMNMRTEFHRIMHDDPDRTSETKRTYAAMLKDFMTALKNNYQQLCQVSTVAGAYVEFVQKIVQFLEQYTSDFCKVLPFFTDNAAFPLPATDPTYVVGRLCGYAPKLSMPGKPKELSVFVQMVAQRASADSQQPYLADQLKTALCTEEAPSADRFALRNTLLQGIFPVYIESAFSSIVGFTLAKPILHSLKPILESTIFDLRITRESNVKSIVEGIVAIVHAFIRSTEMFIRDSRALKQPYVLQATTLTLEAIIPTLPWIEYITSSATGSSDKPMFVAHLEKVATFLADIIHDVVPVHIPSYNGDAHRSRPQYSELMSFCRKSLQECIKVNWAERHGEVFFGQGHARREVTVELESVEVESGRLLAAIGAFNGSVANVYDDDNGFVQESRAFAGDLVI